MSVNHRLLVAVVGAAAALAAGAAGVLAANSTQPAGPEPLFASLLGGNEVTASGQAGAGDLNGRGSVTVMLVPGKGMVCVGITVRNIDKPTAAHIHVAPAGVAGPVVVELTADEGRSRCIERMRGGRAAIGHRCDRGEPGPLLRKRAHGAVPGRGVARTAVLADRPSADRACGRRRPHAPPPALYLRT